MKLTGRWAWENTWLMWTIYGLFLFPPLLTLLTIPCPLGVYQATGWKVVAAIAACGAGWGISVIFIGLAVDAVGVTVSFSVMLGLSAALAQVRHGTVGKSPNPFGISSSDRRVCTTFWIQTLRQAQTELTEQGFLFRGGFGHTPQADLSPIRCG